MTAVVKICHIAEAAGISVITHCGMNDAYGQHISYAMPNIPWGEYLLRSAPGVPLVEATYRMPGIAVPENGHLVPHDAPGFGIELTLDAIEAAVQAATQ